MKKTKTGLDFTGNVVFNAAGQTGEKTGTEEYCGQKPQKNQARQDHQISLVFERPSIEHETYTDKREQSDGLVAKFMKCIKILLNNENFLAFIFAMLMILLIIVGNVIFFVDKKRGA